MQGYQVYWGRDIAWPLTHRHLPPNSPMTALLTSKRATLNSIINLLLEEGQDLELWRLFFKVTWSQRPYSKYICGSIVSSDLCLCLSLRFCYSNQHIWVPWVKVEVFFNSHSKYLFVFPQKPAWGVLLGYKDP